MKMTTTILRRGVALAALAFGLMGALSASAAKSAKAVEYSDGRLVFYYDDADHSSDTGCVKVWTEKEMTAKTAKQSSGNYVYTGVFDSSYAAYKPTKVQYYFYNLDKMTSIEGWENLDTSNATSYIRMFRGCKALTSVDLSRFNCAKVTNMSQMFQQCSVLETIDLASFTNTTALLDISGMFNVCPKLTTIFATPAFDVSHLQGGDQSNLFASCSLLVGGRGTTFDTNTIHDPAYARIDGGPGSATPGYFTQATRTLAISLDDLGSRHIMGVDVRDLNGAVIEPEIKSTAEGNVASYALVYGTNVVITYTAAAGYSFDGYATSEDGRFRETPVTADTAIGLSALPATRANVSLTFDTTVFAGQYLRTDGVIVTLANGLVVEQKAGAYAVPVDYGFTITYQAIDGRYFLIRTVDLARGKKILDSFKTDETYAETGIPEDTQVVPSLTADATKGKVMCGITEPGNARKLTITYNDATPVGRVYVRGSEQNPTWLSEDPPVDITNVVVDSSMSSFKPGEQFEYLFSDMSNVTEIVGLQYLDSSTATSLYCMFLRCRSLTALDLHHFRTPKVTSMYGVFFGCSALETVDITGFSAETVTSCQRMFRECAALKTIYTAADFDLTFLSGEAATKQCFQGCTKLVGGKGTTFTSEHSNDASYARIDGGPTSATPGYFSPRKRMGAAIVIR